MAKVGQVEKITVFQRHPEGVVSVKFKEGASAELAIERLHKSKLSVITERARHNHRHIGGYDSSARPGFSKTPFPPLFVRAQGRPITCEFFDGITDYRMKDDAATEKQRVADFGDWLAGGSNPNKI
eukprot:SAG22_NODE_192_length_15668_cov_4.492389_2_plen_126_part_00